MKHLKLCTCLIILSLTSLNSFAKKKPDWVKQRPNDQTFYMGIGMKPKSGSELSYKKGARDMALKEMTSEIKVTISSNSVLHQMESNFEFKEEYEAKINTSVQETLEGYEVLTWEDKNEYWVMTRLSKDKYKRMREMKLDKAKMMASSYIADAKKALENYDAYSALHLLGKAALSLKDHLEDDLTYKSLDGTTNVGTQISTTVQDVFRRIEIVPSQRSFQIQFSKQMEVPISISATLTNDIGQKMPLANFPLEYKFTKGEGELVPQSKTFPDGTAKVSITRLISKRKTQELCACFDFNSILTEGSSEEDQKVLSIFFPAKQLPSTQIQIDVLKSTAYLISKETVFEKETTNHIFASQIRKELNESFFTFTTNKETADFIVKINTNFSEGEAKKGQGYSLYIVFADLSISISDADSEIEIFTDQLSGIKGARPGNIDYALKDVRAKLLEQFKRKIEPRIEEVDM